MTQTHPKNTEPQNVDFVTKYFLSRFGLPYRMSGQIDGHVLLEGGRLDRVVK